MWRYNTTLPAGTYTFGIDATPSTYPGYNCGTAVLGAERERLVTINAPNVSTGDCGVNFFIRPSSMAPTPVGRSMKRWAARGEPVARAPPNLIPGSATPTPARPQASL